MINIQISANGKPVFPSKLPLKGRLVNPCPLLYYGGYWFQRWAIEAALIHELEAAKAAQEGNFKNGCFHND